MYRSSGQPLPTTRTRTRRTGTMSGTPGLPNTGKAIASLAKIPTTYTTRAGTQKMKFIPTLPIRRKKEYVRPRAIRGPGFAYGA